MLYCEFENELKFYNLGAWSYKREREREREREKERERGQIYNSVVQLGTGTIFITMMIAYGVSPI